MGMSENCFFNINMHMPPASDKTIVLVTSASEVFHKNISLKCREAKQTFLWGNSQCIKKQGKKSRHVYLYSTVHTSRQLKVIHKAKRHDIME